MVQFDFVPKQLDFGDDDTPASGVVALAIKRSTEMREGKGSIAHEELDIRGNLFRYQLVSAATIQEQSIVWTAFANMSIA